MNALLMCMSTMGSAWESSREGERRLREWIPGRQTLPAWKTILLTDLSALYFLNVVLVISRPTFSELLVLSIAALSAFIGNSMVY